MVHNQTMVNRQWAGHKIVNGQSSMVVKSSIVHGPTIVNGQSSIVIQSSMVNRQWSFNRQWSIVNGRLIVNGQTFFNEFPLNYFILAPLKIR
jgi:hypothetical protein